MDQSSEAPIIMYVISGQPGDILVVHIDDSEDSDRSHLILNRDASTRMADKTGKSHQTVDVAEVIRRWTHALQRIHKQSLHLAKANDGEGPDILRVAQEYCSNGHAESLAATLAEHQQHLASFQDYGTDDVGEVTSRIAHVQIDKVSVSPPTIKLPQLLSLIPSSRKAGNLVRRQGTVPQASQTENLLDRKSSGPPSSTQGSDFSYVQNLKRSVRETALLLQPCNSVSSQGSHSDGSSEFFFAAPSHLDAEKRTVPCGSKMSFASPMDDSLLESHASDGLEKSKLDEFPDMFNDLERLSDHDNVNGLLSYAGSNETPDAQWSIYDLEDAEDQVLSPSLLMDSSLLEDSFEDLLAPLSETETAMMWSADSL